MNRNVAPRRGFTLVELSVAMFIAGFITLALLTMFSSSRRMYERPRAAMSIQEDAMHLVRTLEQDLGETNVQTIRSFPNMSYPNEPPGLSMESARDQGGPMTLQFGVVVWRKYVYYTLEAGSGASASTGRLVRREGPLSDQPAAPAPVDSLYGSPASLVPVGSPVLPSQASTAQEHALVQNILLPNQPGPGGQPLDNFGGFKVIFYDSGGMMGSEGSLPPLPHPYDAVPSVGSSDWGRGLPVQVTLVLADAGLATGNSTLLVYPLQIVPRN